MGTFWRLGFCVSLEGDDAMMGSGCRDDVLCCVLDWWVMLDAVGQLCNRCHGRYEIRNPFESYMSSQRPETSSFVKNVGSCEEFAEYDRRTGEGVCEVSDEWHNRTKRNRPNQ